MGFNRWPWQAANLVEIKLEKLKQIIRHLPVDNFNITITDILPHESGGALNVGILEKVAEAHTINEVHHNERTQTKWVAGSGTPCLDSWDRNGSPAVNETQGSHLHGNLLVDVVVTDHPYTRETNHPGGAVAKHHLHAGIKRVMVKGTVELTRKLVGMESRHPLADKARPVGLVHLVDPKLSLRLVDEIDKRVGVHDTREMVEVEHVME